MFNMVSSNSLVTRRLFLNMAGSSRALLLQSSKQLALSFRHISSQTLPRQTAITTDQATSPSRLPDLKSPVALDPPPTMSTASPLSILPLSCVIRSLMVTSISSSRILLSPSLAIMTILAHAKSPILSPDSNPFLRYFLKKTFYKQFCAGENATEVKRTSDSLKSMGFKGVILGYAREVVLDESQTEKLSSCGDSEVAEECIRSEIKPWAKGTLETVEMTVPGDFVALKFTGAGSQALFDLSQRADPSPALRAAIDSVCDLAAKRGIRLLFDAEQQAIQAGIDKWTLDYMRKYNKTTDGKAVIYGTYQAYLKATPAILSSHLAAASKEGFTVGVKLVRGAYLGSDPRYLIHDTKADTDACYDGISESLVLRSYNSYLTPPSPKTTIYPSVDVVLAGHNLQSVRKVQTLRTKQAQKGDKGIELVYAQLQGMADEVSCELVVAGKDAKKDELKDVPRAYKYLVWGTTGECMKYLLRRAHENRDAVERTRNGRNAMARELWRRISRA